MGTVVRVLGYSSLVDIEITWNYLGTREGVITAGTVAELPYTPKESPALPTNSDRLLVTFTFCYLYIYLIDFMDIFQLLQFQCLYQSQEECPYVPQYNRHFMSFIRKGNFRRFGLELF